MIVAVANSDQYGNKAYIAPKARVDDGRLNLVAISPMNPLRLATLVYRLFAGTLDRSRAVTSLLGASFVIERPSPGPLHTDGETHEAGTHITVAVRPASLRILILKPST
jgi:diacylglycerol kinase family enzyme